MIGRSTRRFRHRTSKSECDKVKLTNEHVDGPNWIVLVDVLVQAGGKKRSLSTLLTFNEPLHACLREQA